MISRYGTPSGAVEAEGLTRLPRLTAPSQCATRPKLSNQDSNGCASASWSSHVRHSDELYENGVAVYRLVINGAASATSCFFVRQWDESQRSPRCYVLWVAENCLGIAFRRNLVDRRNVPQLLAWAGSDILGVATALQ